MKKIMYPEQVVVLLRPEMKKWLIQEADTRKKSMSSLVRDALYLVKGMSINDKTCLDNLWGEVKE